VHDCQRHISQSVSRETCRGLFVAMLNAAADIKDAAGMFAPSELAGTLQGARPDQIPAARFPSSA